MQTATITENHQGINIPHKINKINIIFSPLVRVVLRIVDIHIFGA